MSQFTQLRPRWPQIHEAALKAEELALADPGTACFYTRRALELAVSWLYTHDVGILRDIDRRAA
jgi:type I restriction enzyme R subunit